MRNLYKTLALSVLMLPMMSLPAQADPYHRGHDHVRYRHAVLPFLLFHPPVRREVVYYQPTVYAPPPAVVYVTPPQPALVMTANNATQERYCREYQSMATVGGLPAPAYGTACLQPDGSWEIVR